MNELDFIAGLCSTIAAGCLAMAVVFMIGNLVKARKVAEKKKKAASPPPNPGKESARKSYIPDIEEKEPKSSWKNAVIFFLLFSNIMLLVLLSRK